MAKMDNRTIFNSNNINRVNSVNISRLDFLKKITLSLGVLMTACTPVKIILNAHDDKYDVNTTLKNKILEAFVTAVIPGVDQNNPDMCKIFCDEYYPFHKYNGFFISDLCVKSEKLFGTENFFELTLEQRTQVIQAGLDDDSTTERIYTAAIFIAQVSIYCSIYNDERGCGLIDFNGCNGFIDTEMYYPNAQNYLANEITSTGNYA
jgi:hypothetical protein